MLNSTTISFFISSLIFIGLSGISKACMDTLQFHFEYSWFNGINNQFFDPSISWRNKYSDSVTKKEKFFLSSTFLVPLTDGWHLFQMLHYLYLFVGMFLMCLVSTNLVNNDYTIFYIVGCVLINYFIFHLVFESFYRLFTYKMNV